MASPIPESSATNDELAEAIKLRAKYTHFRILVIGRANAGKTTVLKRVCNTDEEPCIYDEDGKNLVRHHSSGMSRSANLTFAAGSDGGGGEAFISLYSIADAQHYREESTMFAVLSPSRATRSSYSTILLALRKEALTSSTKCELS